MPFFSDDEKKEFFTFHEWEDNKTYHLQITKRIDENFSNGKKIVVLVCKDVDSGETFEKKYEFNLMRALDKLGDDYKDESTVLEVTPKRTGDREWNGKTFPVWDFIVRAAGEVKGDGEDGKVTADSVPF